MISIQTKCMWKQKQYSKQNDKNILNKNKIIKIQNNYSKDCKGHFHMTSNDRYINSIYLEYTPYEEYIPTFTLKRTHSYNKKS